MSLFADRVLETSTTEGTGDYALDGAPSNFITFVEGAAIAGSPGLAYVALPTEGTGYEIGIGTVVSGSPDGLERTEILASSNSGNAVNWPEGTRTIFCAPLAEVFRRLVEWDGDLTDIVLRLVDGTAAKPAFSFRDDVDTGLYRYGDNRGGAAAGGVVSYTWGAPGASAGALRVYGDSSTYDSLINAGTNQDSYLRAGKAAGKVAIGDQNTGGVELGASGNAVKSFGKLRVGASDIDANYMLQVLSAVATMAVFADGSVTFRVLNDGSGNVRLETASSQAIVLRPGGNSTLDLRANGEIRVNGNVGSSGQVLMSFGSGAGAAWSTLGSIVNSLTGSGGITVSAATGNVTVSKNTNPAFGVGHECICRVTSLSGAAAGGTIPGSELSPAYFPAGVINSSGSLSGTWRNKSNAALTQDDYAEFIRVS